ncbi:MAG TPA: beta-L-arabinofuranosidase domain-containing protein [Verrucomicrobiae bacterium]|jgi:hypothetical protein
MNRREFLGTIAAASAAVLAGGSAVAEAKRCVLEAFEFSGVSLRPSRWQRQFARARDFYIQVPNDDILRGFRLPAGLPAPGKTLGGWCEEDSYQVFGQWLMAMSRASKINNDTAMREKASILLTEWGKTLDRNPDANGRCKFQQILASSRLSHYFFDKMAGGLVDMHLYAQHPEALPLLEKITDWAVTLLRRDRVPGGAGPDQKADGYPLEWYTLGENLFRAFETTGRAGYRDFAEAWLYPQYWDKFLSTSRPVGILGQHAYSHCNSLSSAAMAAAVTGDPKYLQIARNACDFFQQTQCYATGGYGPGERLMPIDGSLGKSLEKQVDTFECPCGSWAGFKLSKYLMQLTGEARYGDWIEKLVYNGIGAALPMAGRGRTFYYADYRLGSAAKTYYGAAFPCCSATYFQDVTEYHNLIYFKEAGGLCVNLYMPSEVTWMIAGAEAKLIQETNYPEEDTVNLKLELSQPARFNLKFRVPSWARDVSVKVNGSPENIPVMPGSWAVLARLWRPQDRVEIRIPLSIRAQSIDAERPERMALLRGPVVLVQNLAASAMPAIPKDGGLDSWLAPAGAPGVFRATIPMAAEFTAFYLIGESQPYRMYFDFSRPS